MLNSMTGFGKSTIQKNGFSVETEIKSVNSRYLDLSLRLPKAFYQYELDLREQVKKRISRGKLYVTITAKHEGIDDQLSDIDLNGLNATVKLLERIKSSANIKEEIKLEHILNYQSYFMNDTEDAKEEEYKLISQSINEALDSLEEMRKKEGAELAIDFEKRLKIIEDNIFQIEKLSSESIKQYFEKLKDRAIKLASDLIDNQDRLMQELAFLSEKYDVTEECVRLRSHIKMYRDAINMNEPSGRRLNFISQEMNREANTINSKSVSAEISACGISIKEELEKIREQLQNIE
ncbi:MAG: YicC/YloC family endoribonuclease [Melioribacteraceae bacterium]|nr:YicC family protein [Melioribacteraceae bacterium]RJP57191.1 MAG: YicC family protein [Ignavibacteriales bacterium]WKZ68723.1 MAG: YicC/YloC family endoribonuclease [Melioribacteraceae bacterium]